MKTYYSPKYEWSCLDSLLAIGEDLQSIIFLVSWKEKSNYTPFITRLTSCICSRMHSIAKALSPTRGAFMTSLGTGVNPVNAHSLTPGGASIEAKLCGSQSQHVFECSSQMKLNFATNLLAGFYEGFRNHIHHKLFRSFDMNRSIFVSSSFTVDYRFNAWELYYDLFWKSVHHVSIRSQGFEL